MNLSTDYATLLLVTLCVTNALSARPNVVILFADNLGYNDISSFGSQTARTPNIDRLGVEGMRLKNWNSAAHLCSASRSALLTGRYPVRTGIYPGVFKPDSAYGMLPSETTVAEYLKELGYATSIVGKWHLGHRPDFLPTNQGFDEWLGIPYHMSGGSIDNHVCNSDKNETMWLPLYSGENIVQQPVRVEELAHRYAEAASQFIERSVKEDSPFFLYVAFSHVHQLCAPRDSLEPSTCQWGEAGGTHTTFAEAVEEMDWIAGQVLTKLDNEGIAENTMVLFTSDNGPWVAEQKCSGLKGQFEGRWLREHVSLNCTACPHDYIPQPTQAEPRLCVLPGTEFALQGVHCGEDTGLGSLWEANLRMPGLVRFPNRIGAGTETIELTSTLDILPTILNIVGYEGNIKSPLDGLDVSDILFGKSSSEDKNERLLFFWRDGFSTGPLGPPYGRFDVCAVKIGRIKVWFWTKSSHYNNDVEVYHDPPLLFDTLVDPAEAFPLNTDLHIDLIARVLVAVEEHKQSVLWTYPLTLARDAKFIPCSNRANDCRTDSTTA